MNFNPVGYIDHSIIGLLIVGVSDFGTMSFHYLTAQGVDQVTGFIFKAMTLGLIVLFPHSSVFAFFGGFVFSDQVAWLSDKVNSVILAQNTFLRRNILIFGGGFLLLYFQPSTTFVAALYLSAKLGATLDIDSRRRVVQMNLSAAPT